jgi:predicted amidohydrolase YtcJ
MTHRQSARASRWAALATLGLALSLVAATMAVPAAAMKRPRAADLVLHNGEVWTNDGRQSATAVAIKGRRVVAVGRDSRIRRWTGARTRVVNLRGAFVAPGFRDQHTHLLESAAEGETADFYRPTFTPFDPASADAGRTATARRHEEIYNRGETPVDECSHSEVTEQVKRGILVMQREAARQGVTTVVEAGLQDLGVIDALRELDSAGRLRVRHLVRVASGCVEQAARMGLRSGVGSRWVKVLGVKLYADGWLGPRTAALRAPYSDHPEVQYTREPFPLGILFLDTERAISEVTRAAKLGFNITSHAIGDRGAETVLDAYEAVGVRPRDRWQLEHVQVLGEDLFARMADDGVIGSMQLSFATSDQYFAESALGPERVRTSYAWRTMLRRGVRLAGGSDFPIEVLAPLWGLQRVVTRTEFDGTPPGGWHPEERLDLATALRLITSDSAFASFEEKRRGRIKRGNYADLVVLRENLFELPADCIAAATVLMTVTNGKVAFNGQQAYPPGYATCPSGAAPGG